jgi:SRSO17 transposase
VDPGHLGDPVKSAVTGLPPDLAFRTKGQLAIDILAEAFADGVKLDFVCGDEVYGSCTDLREYLEDRDQAYVPRVPSSFRLTLASRSRSPASRPPPGWPAAGAGRSARPGPDRKASAGTPGPGWAPPLPGITC